MAVFVISESWRTKERDAERGYSYRQDYSFSSTFGEGVNLTEIAAAAAAGILVQIVLGAGLLESLFSGRWREVAGCAVGMGVTLFVSVLFLWYTDF
jgi:hypothetical protein